MRQFILFLARSLTTLRGQVTRLLDRWHGNPVIELATYVEDPYTVVNALRNRHPIQRSLTLGGYVILGFEEVTGLMKAPQLTTDIASGPLGRRMIRFLTGTDRFPILEEPWMLSRDPPDHTRLRRLAAVGFTHRFIQTQRDRIETILDDLLPAEGGIFDFSRQVAAPLPARVIAQMIGVPENDRARFQHYSEELLLFLDPSSADHLSRAAKASIELFDYLADLTREKRRNRGDDLLSALIDAEEAGDQLTDKEIQANCALLLIAGHETTSRLLSTGLYLLLKHPVQLKLLRDGEVTVEQAIEECLRFEPPVLGTFRMVKDPFEAFGYTFDRGQTLAFSYAGANRDPRVHERPDDFDITRSSTDHVSFGYGIHLCLGMPLTRLEALIVFETLLERFDQIQLQREPEWSTHPIYRAPTELLIQCKALHVDERSE